MAGQTSPDITSIAVSYTHLDVYKRQGNRRNITYGPRYSMNNIANNNVRSAANMPNGGRGAGMRQTQGNNGGQRFSNAVQDSRQMNNRNRVDMGNGSMQNSDRRVRYFENSDRAINNRPQMNNDEMGNNRSAEMRNSNNGYRDGREQNVQRNRFEQNTPSQQDVYQNRGDRNIQIDRGANRQMAPENIQRNEPMRNNYQQSAPMQRSAPAMNLSLIHI